MKERTLDDEILELVLDYDGAEFGTTKQATDIAQQIKQACFRARDKWVLQEIEKLKKDISEITGRPTPHSTDYVMFDDIRKLLGGKDDRKETTTKE